MAKNRDLSKLANRLTVDNNYNVGISGSLTVTGSIVSTVTTLWSGSAQLPSGVVSGSAQTIANLPSGTVSGSAQVLNGTTIHSGSFFNGVTVVSGSGQISYTGITNVPSGIISGSSQLPSGVVSGSAQTIANLPSGTVSGSVQVDVMSTTNIARLATTGSNIFQGNQTINGSLVVTGSLTAQQFIVSSSVTYLTESFASGSHKFGDSSDDTHQFTGSLTVSGSVGIYANTTASGSLQINTIGNNGTNALVFNGGTSYVNTYMGSFSEGLYITTNYSYASGHRSDSSAKRSMEMYMNTDEFDINTMAAATPGTRTRLLTVSGSAGFIGINTSTPNASLTVSGGGAISFPSNMSSGFVGYSLFQNGNKLTIAGGSGGIQLNNTANSAGLVSLFDNGNVLMANTGTDSGYKLDVQAGASNAAKFVFKVTGDWGGGANQDHGMVISGAKYVNDTNTSLLHITNNDATSLFKVTDYGKIGIGVTTPNSLLTINGTSSDLPQLRFKNPITSGLDSAISTYSSAGQSYLTVGTNFNITSAGSIARINTSYEASAILFDSNAVYIYTSTAAGVASTKMSVNANGYVYLGPGFANSNHRINIARAEGGNILVVSGYDGTNNDTAIFYASGGASPNGAATSIGVMRNSSTNRSINASGTINASGADYAEYMFKAITDSIAKGDVVGVNIDGKLTNIFNDAISFVVKSTDPSYVGGDVWGNEDALGEKRPQKLENQTEEEFGEIMSVFDAKLEVERQKVDRIAFSGQVPVNVTGATVGDYIIPISTEDGKITGQATTNPSFDQYKISVGKVWKIMEDGRAFIAIKIG